MADRAAATVPFAKAHDLLAELGGLALSSKRVERCAEADGTALLAARDAQAAAVAAGELVPLPPDTPVPKLYIALDGTGVPAVPADTESRKGKGPDGRAHTREVKLGALFTQTEVDADGFPVRDPQSSSHVATFEPVQHFGVLVSAEARRQGSDNAGQLVVLGDEAAWIWNLASLHFPAATHIVDLYHAREHLYGLAKLLAPVLGDDRASYFRSADAPPLRPTTRLRTAAPAARGRSAARSSPASRSARHRSGPRHWSAAVGRCPPGAARSPRRSLAARRKTGPA